MLSLSGQWRDILEFLGLTQEDLQVLHAHRTFFSRYGEEITKEFYQEIVRRGPLKANPYKLMNVETLKEELLPYLYTLCDEKIDDKYIVGRQQIGATQAQLGTSAAWLLGGYPTILSLVRNRLNFQKPNHLQFFTALNRRMYFDAAIIVEKFIAETYAKYKIVADNSSDLINIMDVHATAIYVSPSHERLLGYPLEELEGRSAFQFIHPEDVPLVMKKFRPMLEHRGIVHAEFRLIRRDGALVHVEVRAMPVLDASGRIDRIVSVARDITERRRADELIHYMAYHDALTGLLNRRAIEECLVEALNLAEVNDGILAVMYVDIDHFKDINDQLGHSFGDRFLQTVAQRLTTCIRSTDALSRIGGDEFILLLQEMARPADVAATAERIMQSVHEPVVIDETEYFITCSIGYAIYPQDGRDIDTLLKNSDAAMYLVKGKGKDGYLAYASQTEFVSEPYPHLHNDLCNALRSNWFVLHYQPIIDIHSGRMIAAEALVRLMHLEHGLIYPLDFISLTEEVGLFQPLGKWILHEACQQNKNWQETSIPRFRVCVNVSFKQFQQTCFINDVLCALSDTGLEPKWLELEITEANLIQDIADASMKIQRLKAMGISVAIDDFGTGYSSLSYLAKCPVDSLKIDRSIVLVLDKDSQSESIASAVIALAHGLGLDVVAEGVERDSVLNLLRHHQCDRFQGYLVSQPLPADDFYEWVIHRVYEQGIRCVDGGTQISS